MQKTIIEMAPDEEEILKMWKRHEGEKEMYDESPRSALKDFDDTSEEDKSVPTEDDREDARRRRRSWT